MNSQFFKLIIDNIKFCAICAAHSTSVKRRRSLSNATISAINWPAKSYIHMKIPLLVILLMIWNTATLLVEPKAYSHFATFHSWTMLFSIKSNSLKPFETYTQFNIAIVYVWNIYQEKKMKKIEGSEPLSVV